MKTRILRTLKVQLQAIRRDPLTEMQLRARARFEGYVCGLDDAGALTSLEVRRLRQLADCAQFYGHGPAFWESAA